MVITEWIVWGLLLILFLCFLHSFIRMRPSILPTTRIEFSTAIVLAGISLIIAAFGVFSKLHLLWLFPAEFVVGLVIMSLAMKQYAANTAQRMNEELRPEDKLCFNLANRIKLLFQDY